MKKLVYILLFVLSNYGFSQVTIYSENFTGVADGNIPATWSRTHTNWGANSTTNSGGTTPELRLNWNPSTTGTLSTQTPSFSLSAYSSCSLSFKQNIDWYGNTPTFKVQASSDGAIWSDVWSYNTGADIIAETRVIDLSAYDGEATVFLKWSFVGNTLADLNYWYIDDIQVTGVLSSPTVTTSAVSSISTTTATGNGTITNIGGSAITTSGVCWNTSTGPTTANSKTTDGATSATSYTSSMTGLSAQTLYYVKAYATNSTGTSYGAEETFRTLSTEPTSHSGTFTATLNGTSQIDLTFSAATSIGNSSVVDGYIILRRIGSAPTSGGIVDGTAPGSLTLTDATLVAIITNTATTSYSQTGLSGGSTFYYTLIPFNYDGTNDETYNYYIGGTIPSANATTPEFYSPKGLSISGNFTNEGTFVQTNDGNYLSMTGTTKSLTGAGTFTDSKIYIDGTITYDGESTSYIQKTMVNTAKTFTISNNKTYHNELMTIDGTLVISATSSQIKNSGNWTNNGTFTANTGSLVTFDGSSGTTQTIGGSNTSFFYNATINNTSGDVTLGIDTDITNVLTLTSGKLYTDANTLTIGTNSSNGSISGGGSSTYIVAYDNVGTIGYLKRFLNSNTSYTYPIGDATYYTPLTFTLTSNAGLSNADFTVYTKAEKVTGLNSGLTTYIDRSWEGISTGITTPVYTISYVYDDADIVGTEADMLPVKLSSGSWYKPTGSSFTDGTEEGTGSVNTGSNTLTWTGLSTFSLFGGAGNEVSPLPIELLSFTGIKEGKNNQLKWTTASEKNNDYFTIEKTIDGIEFNEIGTREGAGNSIYYNSYQLTDMNVEPVINYYRLKQTDFDGNSTYSNLISIDNRIEENTNRKLLKITNTLGQEIKEGYFGVVIYIYSDGTIERKFNY